MFHKQQKYLFFTSQQVSKQIVISVVLGTLPYDFHTIKWKSNVGKDIFQNEVQC